MNRYLIFFISLVVVAVLAIGGWAIVERAPDSRRVACTEEAMLCSDGSTVGRTGPNCEFAKCPGDASSVSFEIYQDVGRNFSFQYPRELATSYISAPDWPPKVQIMDEAYECAEAGSEDERAGKTERRVVNGHEYCVTEVKEGAAGSIYSQFAFAKAHGDKTVIFTFSLRYSQCGNYEESEKSMCEEERRSFDIHAIMDQIGQSFRYPAAGGSTI